MGRRTPCAAEHHHKSKTHSGDDGAREEQPLDAVLDRVQDHEGENEPQHEQEQRAQQRMPKSRFDSLAQLNHGRDGTRLTGGRPSTGTPVHGAEPSSRHVSVRTRYACPAPAEAFRVLRRLRLGPLNRRGRLSRCLRPRRCPRSRPRRRRSERRRCARRTTRSLPVPRRTRLSRVHCRSAGLKSNARGLV